MSDEEKPLPKPPGQKKFREGGDAPILADRIAEALAGGRLDELMKHEIPDSDQARTLVSMMMGMTGMLPPEGLAGAGDADASSAPPEKGPDEITSSEPPEDVREAAHAADMGTLVGLLKREHEKRSDAGDDAGCDGRTGAPTIGREDIDRLIGIASENSLSPDWIILRAIRLYVREYERTGRL